MSTSATTNNTLTTHILGYPRIGGQREGKFALERYWAGKITRAELDKVRADIFTQNIKDQVDAGLSLITVGDFAAYDSMLTQSVAFGVTGERFVGAASLPAFDRQFYLARGRDHTGQCPDTAAWQMTKWFDTNYHYLVPELKENQPFKADFSELLEQVAQAKLLAPKHPLKAVVIGPLTYLYLASSALEDRLGHLDALIPAYCTLFTQLSAAGVTWVQMDEPILALDLDGDWCQAFERAYHQLQQGQCAGSIKLLLTTYFDELGNNTHLACHLPVQGVHIDVTRSSQPKQLVQQLIDQLPPHKVLSVGIVDGRSVWATDQARASQVLSEAYARLGDKLWVGSGCSLLHLPVDIRQENVPSALVGKLAFAKQKLSEVSLCGQLATGKAQPKPNSTGITLNAALDPLQKRTGDFTTRFKAQQKKLNLPLLPTTTIGSFPQTTDIRRARKQWKQGTLSEADYTVAMQDAIKHAIAEQEALGLDVLVHGEAERTDMVEYFAAHLAGFWLSEYGWVQSYGTRCVRPPIVTGDISRPQPITVKWITYAQAQTAKPVKGMLTGPVTILNWSFAPRDTATRDILRRQLAEAIHLEVRDLQAAGVSIIQIDEAAFREGLPLKASQHPHYWHEAVAAFKHTAHSACIDTQIHTHMCYSSFHDCLDHITAMDADVITIETARSGLQLLDAFGSAGGGDNGAYPNGIGPGVYDIHSPRTPEPKNMQVVIDRAQSLIPIERLWVNPDCGLKTRGWSETRAALNNMVTMAKAVRGTYAQQTVQSDSTEDVESAALV